MKRTLTISALIGSLVLSSCRRDDLYYATNDRVAIRIEADWSPAHLTPNGASAFVFDARGSSVGEIVQSNDHRKIDLSLPEGNYTVVVVNNSLAEYRNVVASDAGQLKTFALMARTVSPNFASVSGTRSKIFVGEPDTVAGSVVRNIAIDHKMIEYYRKRPQGVAPAPAATFATTPKRLISVADIEIHVKGLKYAGGAPRTHLRNFTGGRLIDSDRPSEQHVNHEFVLNNRRFDAGSIYDGTISKQLATFGLHGDPSTRYLLNMEFVLINGEKYPIELDLTDRIEVIDASPHTILRIRASIELPEVIGNGSGAFDPDLEEWEDINVDIPM